MLSLKNSMKKTLIFLFCLSSVASLAQRELYDESSYSIKDRGYFGAGLSGLNFGRDQFNRKFFSIGVSGQLGYMLTKNLSTGVGLEYTFTDVTEYKQHIYGGYPFIRYNIKNFFLQTDYNIVTIKVTGFGQEAKESFDRFFAGIGYSSPAGNGGYLNILASYDFLYTNSSPFASPISIRVYFTGGFRN